ncbi:MAG TPA: DUF1810 domain-containing protein [Candidatus Scybalousia intestinigallinarum]|nr:DUF1810 domain-containing protein [Candidatus Scybalousia intestinigallinarum]
MKNLERFLQAQEKSYEIAYQEIKNGRKEGHWIWYIFPQIQGLGESATSFYYGIQNLNEAKEYLENPILHDRLIEISNALLSLSGKSASEILGTLDAIKVRSSMTLFSKADPNEKVFAKVLEKYYQNELDSKTLEILKSQNTSHQKKFSS